MYTSYSAVVNLGMDSSFFPLVISITTVFKFFSAQSHTLSGTQGVSLVCVSSKPRFHDKIDYREQPDCHDHGGGRFEMRVDDERRAPQGG